MNLNKCLKFLYIYKVLNRFLFKSHKKISISVYSFKVTQFIIFQGNFCHLDPAIAKEINQFENKFRN